ncbi:MAG: dUTP diphosphatase [Clostridia bacterium]
MTTDAKIKDIINREIYFLSINELRNFIEWLKVLHVLDYKDYNVKQIIDEINDKWENIEFRNKIEMCYKIQFTEGEAMKVKIVNKSGFPLPKYETKGSAGFDIRAILPKGEGYSYMLYPHKQVNLKTGLYFEIPEGYELRIQGRSGNAMRYGISITQGLGCLDSDYRGELNIFLTNHGNKPFEIKHGDRVAQGIISPVYQAEWVEVDELDKTERGENGFGSTGN